MSRSWRARYPIAHRLERDVHYAWEWVTWEPLYWVRRVICRSIGHDWHDSGSVFDPDYELSCRRCAEDGLR